MQAGDCSFLYSETAKTSKMFLWACGFSLLAHACLLIKFPEVIFFKKSSPGNTLQASPTVVVNFRQSSISQEVPREVSQEVPREVSQVIEEPLPKVKDIVEAKKPAPKKISKKERVKKPKAIQKDILKEMPNSTPRQPEEIDIQKMMAQEPPSAPDQLPAQLMTGVSRSEALKEIENSYEEVLIQWLKQYKKYPKVAQKREQEGVVLVRFTISEKGDLLAYSFVKESPYRMLNKAVQKMLNNASPMPQVPIELRRQAQQFTYTIPIEFKLL